MPQLHAGLRPRDLAIAGALAAVLLGGAAYRVIPGVCGVYHDDAIYVLSAKAMAAGQGYRLISLPGAPLQTKYPVLYPAVLSLIWKASPRFPENGLLLQSVSMLFGAAAVALAYLYMVRFEYISRAGAAASTGLFATTPAVLYFATQTLSEMPFAALVVAGLWTLERLRSTDSASPREELLAGAILALSALCRTVGGVLPLLGIALLFRDGRRLRWVCAGIALVILPWAIWSVAAMGAAQHDPITDYYIDYSGDWLSLGRTGAIKVLLTNSLLLIFGTATIAVDGIRPVITYLNWPPLSTSLAWLAVAAGVVGWATIARQVYRRRVLPSFLLGYAFVIAVWPWPPGRFLIPVLPFLVAYLIIGVSALFRTRAPRGWCAPAAALALCVAIVANVEYSAVYERISHQTGYPYNTIPDRLAMWSSYQHVFDWIRTHSDSHDVVASGLDSMVSLYTDRPSVRPFVHRPLSLFYGDTTPATGTVEEFSNILKIYHAKYVVELPMPGFAEEKPFADLISSWRLRREEDSVLVYEDDDSRFRIFEVLRPS
jgi:hypothetical protein